MTAKVDTVRHSVFHDFDQRFELSHRMLSLRLLGSTNERERDRDREG